MINSILKRIMLASAMVLYIQPLLSMENANPFPGIGEPNINRTQVSIQQPQLQQLQPQVPMILTPQTNNEPQNLATPPSARYVLTSKDLFIIKKAIYKLSYINQGIIQTVYPVQQPLQLNMLQMSQNQQALTSFAAFSENYFAAEKVTNDMQQQLTFNPAQGQLQPAHSQELRGVKRKAEETADSNLPSRENQLANTSMLFSRFGQLPPEIQYEILQIVSTSILKDIDNLGKLKPMGNPIKLIKFVCKEWKGIVDGKHDFAFANEVIRSVYSLNNSEFEVYQKFVKGKVIFRPDGKTDKERIDLLISSLWNPLEGTFELPDPFSRINRYLTISTGYRKGTSLGNASRQKIWLTPRFLVEKGFERETRHFRSIFPADWLKDIPVGIFWTLSEWDNLEWCDYVTDQSLDNLSHKSLEAHERAAKHAPATPLGGNVVVGDEFFHVHFPA